MLRLLLAKFPNLTGKLTKKEVYWEAYYYIYVGITIKESVRDRLNWHVNDSMATLRIKWRSISP